MKNSPAKSPLYFELGRNDEGRIHEDKSQMGKSKGDLSPVKHQKIRIIFASLKSYLATRNYSGFCIFLRNKKFIFLTRDFKTKSIYGDSENFIAYFFILLVFLKKTEFIFGSRIKKKLKKY